MLSVRGQQPEVWAMAGRSLGNIHLAAVVVAAVAVVVVVEAVAFVASVEAAGVVEVVGAAEAVAVVGGH